MKDEKSSAHAKVLDRKWDDLRQAFAAAEQKRGGFKAQEGGYSYEASMFMPKMENDRLQLHLYDVIDDYWGCGPTGLVECHQTHLSLIHI